jgi:hypothetical protein
MKLRTKEEMAAYRRELRSRKDVTPSVTPKVNVTPKVVTPVTPCLECKKLLAKIALLELQIKKGVKSEPLPSGDDVADLFARNVAAKNARFQKLGMMAH